MTRDDALLECLTRWGTEPKFVGPVAETSALGCRVGWLRQVWYGREPVIMGRGSSWEAAFAKVGEFAGRIDHNDGRIA